MWLILPEMRIRPILFGTTLFMLFGVSWCALKLEPALQEVVRYVNQSFIITCQDSNNEPVRWVRGANESVGDRGNPHVYIVNGLPALVFEGISFKHNGLYTCRSADGHQHLSFKFRAIAPITFSDTDLVQTAQEHRSTTIKCKAKADSKPNIVWKFEGKDVNSPRYKTTSEGLRIDNVTLEDRGIYTCTAWYASEIEATFEEKIIKLNVQHKPLHKKPVHAKVNQAYGYIGGEVNLTCEAVADPAANFTWFRRHRKIIPGRIIEEPHWSILKLYIQNSSVFGDYLCKAMNELGTLDQIISLQEGVKPPQPQGLKLRATSSDSIDVEVTEPEFNNTLLPPNMLPSGYRLQYRPKEGNVKWHDAGVADFNDIAQDAYSITGLSHNTEYEVRVATKNLAGLSDYTPHITCRTMQLQADSVYSSCPPYRTNMLCVTMATLLYVLAAL